MFSFKRKDKDGGSSGAAAEADKKDRKRDKEKKDRGGGSKRKDQNSLTSDDLKRLEDARRSLLGRGKKKDKEKLPSGITADYVSNFYQSDATAEFSYVPGTKPVPPVVPPKPPKRGILKGLVDGPPAPIPGSDRDSFFDERHLMENTIQNELIGYNLLQANSVPVPKRNDVPPSEEEFREEDTKSSGSLSLDCPLPQVLPAKPPRARTVEITRLASGDFGFSLRRATIMERFQSDATSSPSSGTARMKTVIFAEPGLLGRTNETGLLPGDKLLQVNGTNVERMSRDEIITLIRASGDSVVLKVQPVPELLELSRRSWGAMCDDETGGELDDAYIRGGTLRRSGSKRRLIGSQAKSDGQLASEKAWLEADRVWVIHKRGFCGGTLLKNSEEAKNNGIDGVSAPDKVRVKLDFNSQLLDVDEEDVEKANPPHLDHIEDLSQLRFVNESSVLHVIRQRYGSNLVHTYAGGNSLIVVNPMSPLSVYSDKVAQLFKGCRSEDMPPHIYAVAQKAHAAMLATRRDQSIVLLGRSGSGKTTNSQHVLNYLLLTAGHHSKSVTVDKLHAIFKLLDAFGNSRTVMNTNASRYSNVFSLDFDPSGNVVSASVQVLMLEKSRVVRRPEGEPNFHVFYQLLAGVDTATRKQLHLEDAVAVDGSSAPCLFMTPLQRAEDKQRAFVAWGHIMGAMQSLNIQPKEVRVLCSVLAAIYHLGVAGAALGPGGKFQFVRPQFAAWAASLLGTTLEELIRILRGGSPSSGGSSTSASPGGSASTQVPPQEALEGFVTGLYSEVFSALIALINRSISASNSQASNSIVVVDSPGVQNPASCGRSTGASFEDLCHNYLQERLQLLFHDMTFTMPQDRYAQEQVEFPVVENVSCEEGGAGSPGPMVNLLDFANQSHSLTSRGPSQSDMRGGRGNEERRGLLWLLDDEAIFPGSSDRSLLERIATCYGDRQWRPLLTRGPEKQSVTLMHLQGTCPVTYNLTGWLKACRENPLVRAAACCLTETSTREEVRELFTACRPSGGGSGATGLVSGSIAGIEGAVGLRRASSIRRAFTTGTASIRRKSVALQTKFQADGLLENLRRTRVHFVHCFLPQHNAGLCDLKHPQSPDARAKDEILMNVPLVRSQLRGAQILEAIRVHKQGFPESVPFREFLRRFSVLVPPEGKQENRSMGDEKRIILDYLVPQLDLEPNVFRVGLSQIFFRAGVVSQLESLRDEQIQGRIVMLQAYCRGCLARRKLAKRRVEDVAIRCIQRNVSKYLAVRSWPWWRLLTKVTPLLNVHRTEEELRSRTEEVENLKTRLEKAEKERAQLKSANDRLETRLSELTADLAEEHSTSTLAAERLEAETAERMRLQQEFARLQADFKSLEKSKEKVETELMYSRAAAAQVNGESFSAEEDGVEDNSVYKVRYERAMREMEYLKQRLTSKHEEDVEQLVNIKKNLEKRLHDSQEETEEQRQIVSQWKRKITRLQGELADLKHLHEEQTGRNNILEKRQRKFDSELQACQDEVKAERREKERIQRERDLALGDKYSLEQALQTARLEYEMKDERVQSLMKELDDISSSAVGDNELTTLKRLKHDLELRVKDQDEELDDLSGQAQLLEAAKTRLEMSIEQIRKEHRKEIAQLTEEMEEIRANAQKKVRALEAQLETEHDERTHLMREKHELERKLTELHTNGLANKADQSKIQALKRELKKHRALLQDAQTALDRAQKDNNPSRIIIRQLKNQIEDLEFAKMAAVKARQCAEAEVRDLQGQMEEISRSKSEIESRVVNLQREKNSLLSQLEDHEDELKEVMRKFKASVQQTSVDQSFLVDQANQIAQLEQERNNLRDSLNELTCKLEAMAGEEVHALEAKKLSAKIRQLEGRFELEQSTKTRMEAMITKLKEQVEALTQDLENSRLREQTAQEAQKRAVRQLRDAQDEYATLQLRETEALSKKEGLEQQLDQYETENLTLKSDLTLALKRIEDLQAAMQDVQDDSDSDLGSGRIGSSGDEDEDSDSDAETFASSSFGLGKRPEHLRSRHSSQSTSATNEDEADRSLRIEEERFALSPSAVNKTGGISLLESPTGNESHESEV